jgi:hypothetical protein
MNNHADARNLLPLCATVCAVALCTVTVAGCSSNPVQAEWKDPAFAGHSLRGAKVLVVCDAADLPIKRVCEEQMSAQVQTAGAIPVTAPEITSGGNADAHNEKIAAAARNASAKAILLATVAPDTTVVNPGPSVGIGVGGFGGFGGWRSGGIGTGVGVSVPVGAARTTTGYAANMVLKDTDSGRVIWTSKVSAPASQDINMQMNTIAKAGVEAAQKAAVF